VILLMRRNGSGGEPNGIQPALLAAALGQEQMAVVDWVETATVKSKTHRDKGGRRKNGIASSSM